MSICMAAADGYASLLAVLAGIDIKVKYFNASKILLD